MVWELGTENLWIEWTNNSVFVELISSLKGWNMQKIVLKRTYSVLEDKNVGEKK